MGRVIDTKATAAARERQARGRSFLDAIFGVNEEYAASLATLRRVEQGRGPSGHGRFTRKHWMRTQRRAKAKAQRIARRKGRLL